MEADKFKPKVFPFVPHTVIMEVILEFSIQAKRKNLTLTSCIDRSTDMKIYGDAFQFRQILINVISNAIKYTDRGVIYVSASLMRNDQVRSVLELSIEDTGRGISKDQLPYIFEEYNTQNDGWEIKEGSTGLGLYIVKKIIDSHKGEIKVSSEPGKGSSFTIKLPYDIFPELETIGSTNLPCRKILLVENDPLNLKILSLCLANENQMVTNSMDGGEAFSIYIRNHFDLVITDISLPGLNGFELASKIRELPDSKKSSVPIIAISGFEKHDKQQEQGCSDINAWLVKPFDTNLLLIKVEELCNTSLYRTNKFKEYN
jgi:CheY-like chemotaxis protein